MRAPARECGERSRVSVENEDAAVGVEMKAVYSALDGHNPGGEKSGRLTQPTIGDRLRATPLWSYGTGHVASLVLLSRCE